MDITCISAYQVPCTIGYGDCALPHSNVSYSTYKPTELKKTAQSILDDKLFF
jgi:hypothetical protein